MGPAVIIPVVAGVGLLGTLAVLRARKVSLESGGGPVSRVGTVPDFNKSPPATAAVPAGKPTEGIPVITADQFKALDARRQETIREDALKGILTLTATNGALFTEQSTDSGMFKEGADIKGMFMTVDVTIAKRLGTDLTAIAPVGNVIFEALQNPGPTHTPGISRDPRKPGISVNIPNAAITGAGDP